MSPPIAPTLVASNEHHNYHETSSSNIKKMPHHHHNHNQNSNDSFNDDDYDDQLINRQDIIIDDEEQFDITFDDSDFNNELFESYLLDDLNGDIFDHIVNMPSSINNPTNTTSATATPIINDGPITNEFLFDCFNDNNNNNNNTNNIDDLHLIKDEGDIYFDYDYYYTLQNSHQQQHNNNNQIDDYTLDNQQQQQTTLVTTTTTTTTTSLLPLSISPSKNTTITKKPNIATTNATPYNNKNISTIQIKTNNVNQQQQQKTKVINNNNKKLNKVTLNNNNNNYSYYYLSSNSSNNNKANIITNTSKVASKSTTSSNANLNKRQNSNNQKEIHVKYAQTNNSGNVMDLNNDNLPSPCINPDYIFPYKLTLRRLKQEILSDVDSDEEIDVVSIFNQKSTNTTSTTMTSSLNSIKINDHHHHHQASNLINSYHNYNKSIPIGNNNKDLNKNNLKRCYHSEESNGEELDDDELKQEFEDYDDLDSVSTISSSSDTDDNTSTNKQNRIQPPLINIASSNSTSDRSSSSSGSSNESTTSNSSSGSSSGWSSPKSSSSPTLNSSSSSHLKTLNNNKNNVIEINKKQLNLEKKITTIKNHQLQQQKITPLSTTHKPQTTQLKLISSFDLNILNEKLNKQVNNNVNNGYELNIKKEWTYGSTSSTTTTTTAATSVNHHYHYTPITPSPSSCNSSSVTTPLIQSTYKSLSSSPSYKRSKSTNVYLSSPQISTTTTTTASAAATSHQNGYSNENPIEKRAFHILSERQRRNDLKKLFETLRMNIPSLSDKQKASKLTILKAAAEHLNEINVKQLKLNSLYEKEKQRQLQLLHNLKLLQSNNFK